MFGIRKKYYYARPDAVGGKNEENRRRRRCCRCRQRRRRQCVTCNFNVTIYIFVARPTHDLHECTNTENRRLLTLQLNTRLCYEIRNGSQTFTLPKASQISHPFLGFLYTHDTHNSLFRRFIFSFCSASFSIRCSPCGHFSSHLLCTFGECVLLLTYSVATALIFFLVLWLLLPRFYFILTVDKQ